MVTITEDFVSFEIAKLLKKSGFDEPCYQCYVLIDKFVETSYYEFTVNSKFIKFERLYADEQPLINSKGFRDFINNKDKSRVFAAPTLQMAMKWLRIKHNIHIEPHIVKTKYSYGYMPNYIDLKELKPHFPFDEFDFSNADKYVCITHDKACEVTIKYCLEHLI